MQQRTHFLMRVAQSIAVLLVLAGCAATQQVGPRTSTSVQPVGETRAAPLESAPAPAEAIRSETPATTQPATPTKPIPRKFNLTGYPAGFRLGFNAGCDDARHGLTTASDRTRYNADSVYRSGWRDGYTVCRGKK